MLVHATQQAEALAFPRRHHDEHDQAQRQRQPAAGDNLVEVGGEQRHVDTQEAHQNQPYEQLIPVPVPVCHRGGEDRRQHHRSRHGNTVRRGQVAGVFEADDNNHDRKIEQPVNERYVDLAGFHFRRMDNAHRREIAQTHSLTGQGEDAGNHRLRRNHRRQRGEDQHRDQRPVGGQQEERVFNRFRVFKQQRPWPK